MKLKELRPAKDTDVKELQKQIDALVLICQNLIDAHNHISKALLAQRDLNMQLVGRLNGIEAKWN